MHERNIIGGVTASVLSPFVEGWQEMLRIKITRYGLDDDDSDINKNERTPLRHWRGVLLVEKEIDMSYL